MLSHSYNIVIDCGIGAPGHGKDVVDILSTTDKIFFTLLMRTVQLTGASSNNPQMVMHASISNTGIIIESGL